MTGMAAKLHSAQLLDNRLHMGCSVCSVHPSNIMNCADLHALLRKGVPCRECWVMSSCGH